MFVYFLVLNSTGLFGSQGAKAFGNAPAGGKSALGNYTLSRPENDRDVTHRVQEYTPHCKTHPLCVNLGVPF